MHRSTYEAPIEAPSDDTVVLPDALNLPTYTAPSFADPGGETPVVVAPPIPPMPPQPLPEAPPVARVHAERAFPIRNVTIVACTVVVTGIVVTLAAILGSEPAPVADEQTSITVPSTSGLPGERGGPFVRRTAPPSVAPEPTPTKTAAPAPAPELEPEPVREAPVPPPESTPPTPQQSTPMPAPPVVPTAPVPLTFVGITENRGENVFGTDVVMSRTLSMTGEPGSTASVRYGWRDAGTMVFDDDGSAALEIERSTLLLIPGNARISAQYADGTEGDPIEARRDDIAG